MNRRTFTKLALMLTAIVPLNLRASSNPKTIYKFKPTGVVHHMKGPFIQQIKEENGQMFCHDMCDCGCIDKKWKINKGDTVVAFHPALIGNLRGLTIIAVEFKCFGTTQLTGCRLQSRDFEKYPLY